MIKGFDKEVLRTRITRTREEKGMNQARLAEQAGITPAAISQIEKGLRVPTIPVLRKISSVLGVTMDYLTGKTDKLELEDMLQYEDFKTFYRRFRSLDPDDQKTVSKIVELMRSKKK